MSHSFMKPIALLLSFFISLAIDAQNVQFAPAFTENFSDTCFAKFQVWVYGN